ncbi:lactate utilization protein B [Rhabdochromatium marinum]|uniref:lactate utilization protein B n=1 Tax=Rhabdochromatium marinum TaxID=48729 RepID=UPI00190373F3|nr:lactate utilization protein B [Rhabdochromatium marinum]MBK1648891.1 (Fe-S)-binding protein [Rhabdochromatium marinum]
MKPVQRRFQPPWSRPSSLQQRLRTALARQPVRRNIARAMNGLVDKRRAAFPDAQTLEALRDQGQAIRDQALDHLPTLLRELEANCTANGIQVHWAETPAEANAQVLDIVRAAGADAVLKGKSMVSEEIGLNAALAAAGIEALETDLGEWIIQLAGEAPAHIVAPAVHLSRQEVAARFRTHFPELEIGEDIADLTALARGLLRDRFARMRVGVTGVNFLVAETGSLCLIENEGNGRLCTTLPEVHIAITGIEKVIARLDQLPPLLRLLTRSATGQPATTYVNLISGPRRTSERDGPHEVHLILLDHGRARMQADPEQRAILRCIRCGACMNHCPVYTRVGGHGYGTVYPGPLGAVLEPRLQGLQLQGELAEASSLCGACAEVCPVRIPLPQLIRRVRRDQRARQARPGLWSLWSRLQARPLQARRFTRALAGLAPALNVALRWLPSPWTRSREPPRLARQTLADLAEQEGFADD